MLFVIFELKILRYRIASIHFIGWAQSWLSSILVVYCDNDRNSFIYTSGLIHSLVFIHHSFGSCAAQWSLRRALFARFSPERPIGTCAVMSIYCAASHHSSLGFRRSVLRDTRSYNESLRSFMLIVFARIQEHPIGICAVMAIYCAASFLR
jgi:hypothetical protein